MRVVVTGSRSWDDYEKIRSHISGYGVGTVFVHGGARGADSMVSQAIREENSGPYHWYEYREEIHPADWETHGKRAGIIRNLEMLNTSPDLVLAFWDGKSRGTQHCISAARVKGIPVEVISP